MAALILENKLVHGEIYPATVQVFNGCIFIILGSVFVNSDAAFSKALVSSCQLGQDPIQLIQFTYI